MGWASRVKSKVTGGLAVAAWVFVSAGLPDGGVAWSQSRGGGAGAAGVGRPALPGASAAVPDARFTILLVTFEGPGHVRMSKEGRDQIAQATGLRELHLVHGERASTLYFGFYRTVSRAEDPVEAARAQADLARIQAIRIGDSQPFQAALFVPLPSPDPEAPREWDIRNARGVYSLEIGAFRDRPDRKQAAVEAVREARAMGLEAYFYHGPTTSSVLIGAFPAEALRTVRPDARISPDREVLVLPFKPKDIPDEIERPDGARAQIVEYRVEVVDPQLLSLMRQFPEHAVNGAVPVRRIRDPRTGQVIERLAESFIVDITQIQRDSLLSAGAEIPENASRPTPPSEVLAPRPTTPGSDKLRGIR